MKTRLFSRGLLVALFASASLFLVSCDKDDDDNDDVMFDISGNATGAQEVPAVNTTATGTLVGTYNRNTNVLTYNISWVGLSGNVTVAHFHGPADNGESASPLIDLVVSTNGLSGNITGSATLTDEVEDYLLDGKLYYNLHTVLNPNGEIRGQVNADED